MKKLLLLFVFGCQVMNAEKLPLKEQLIALNKNWQNKSLPNYLRDSSAEQLDDISLIRLHFKLVEVSLRKSKVIGLSKQQLQKRKSSIAALHAYAERGEFPKNYHFDYRRPVFIDEHGTYCAVGELIRVSGQDALAQKVHAENNFGYIRELEKQYVALGTWASENGFTIDELAWIQPCYGNTCADTIGLVHPSCYKGFNGYYRPDYVTFKTIKNRELYKLVDTTWIHWTNALCGNSEPCNLVAGQYRWEITDSLDVVHTFSATLVAPDSAVVNILQLGDFSSCNGTIVVTPIGGAPPFRYKWQNETIFTKDSIRTGFCEQPISVTVIEARYIFCDQKFTFFAGQTAITNVALNEPEVFPNPCEEQISFSSLPVSSHISIFSLTGQLLFERENSDVETKVDVRSFSPGIFLYQIKCNTGILNGKFIKH